MCTLCWFSSQNLSLDSRSVLTCVTSRALCHRNVVHLAIPAREETYSSRPESVRERYIQGSESMITRVRYTTCT